MTAISQELLRVYRATEYRAETPFGALTIKIDARCPALDTLLRRHHAESWAFITAWNPRSERCDLTTNLAAQRNLLADLESARLIVFEGVARDPSGAWPDEPSFLALGASEAFARDMAIKYSQNGFVFGEVGKAARLIIVV